MKNIKKGKHYPTLPFMKKRRAFTLVELMIAMAIIAILATAGIQAYAGYVKKGRDTARAQMARDLNTAVVSYAASNNGIPPADENAFDEFLESAGKIFVGQSGGGASNVLGIKDPVGGKDVCLDAEGNANQPCSFNYTAYEDGTYAISYGVEHETSTETNFYKTTASVPAANATTYTAPAVPKYGVYIGTAKYIGQPPTTENQNTEFNDDEDGVDEVYTPPGETVAQPLVAVFRSTRVDVPVVSDGGGGSGGSGTVLVGGSCPIGNECAPGLSCQYNVCWTTTNSPSCVYNSTYNYYSCMQGSYQCSAPEAGAPCAYLPCSSTSECQNIMGSGWWCWGNHCSNAG